MEKKGLGKGLGALIPGVEKEDRQGVSELDITRIATNPYQPRETWNDDKFQELVNSVRVHGVLQPLLVRSKGDGSYELVAGERRLRAAKASGLSRVPVVIRELTNEQSLQVALIENLQREDINAVDAAVAYKRLTDEFGLSQEEIAFSLGKSRSAVANTMRLLNLPDAVRNYVKSGKISEGHARAALGINGSDGQILFCEAIVNGGLSVRDSERLAKEWGKEQEVVSKRESVSRETTPARPDPNMLDVESRLRQIFGTKVNVIMNKDRGRIEIEFYSDGDLERLLLLLAGA